MLLNISRCEGFVNHRSGWNYAISSLKPLHSGAGLYLDGFIEKSFSWQLNSYTQERNAHKLPYRFPWVGFIHNPHNMPHWFDYFHSPQSILGREVFQESLRMCRGLFVLSDYFKVWLEKQVEVPVFSFKHPTEPARSWSPEAYLKSKEKNIIQLGYWLRNIHSITALRGPHKRFWMPSNPQYAQILKAHYYQAHGIDWLEQAELWAGIEILDFLPNEKYDDFLSCSVVFLDLFDASANNAIIECISRATPVIVNRHPAVVEYLGEDYPMYYSVGDPLPGPEQIMAAHKYLKNMNKEWLKGENFMLDIKKALESL